MYEDVGNVKHLGLFYNCFRVVKIYLEINLDKSCEDNCYIVHNVTIPCFFLI